MNRFTVAKVDADKHEVYGWAFVSVNAAGRLLVDYQDDSIPPEELERAAHNYLRDAGVVNEMHRGDPVGKVIESLVVTDEKLEAMGLARTSAPRVAWWVGLKLSPETFRRVKQGDLRMLSIEGSAEAEEV